MMSAVSSLWMYLLVTEPLAWPTSAAIVTSVKTRSLVMLAKLCRRTWASHPTAESSRRCTSSGSGSCRTRCPHPALGRRRCRDRRHTVEYSTTGNPTGRMDSPSLLSSNRKQLDSLSASVHFRPIISLRLQPVSASWRTMSTIVTYSPAWQRRGASDQGFGTLPPITGAFVHCPLACGHHGLGCFQ